MILSFQLIFKAAKKPVIIYLLPAPCVCDGRRRLQHGGRGDCGGGGGGVEAGEGRDGASSSSSSSFSIGIGVVPALFSTAAAKQPEKKNIWTNVKKDVSGESHLASAFRRSLFFQP